MTFLVWVLALGAVLNFWAAIENRRVAIKLQMLADLFKETYGN